MTSNQTGDFLIDPETPDWGFGFGAVILRNHIAAKTQQFGSPDDSAKQRPRSLELLWS